MVQSNDNASGPRAIREFVFTKVRSLVTEAPAHPLSANRFFTSTPESKSNLEELAAACSEGARLRGALVQRLIQQTNPQVSLVVFPELHHAGHQLWHTVAPEHWVYNGLGLNGNRTRVGSFLCDVYRAVDQQIGALVDSVSTATTVMVFALHGMRPALGFSAFLGPLLCERGFSSLANWRSQSWSKRALSMFAATKRHAPAALKKLYYQVTPITATYKLARPTMLPAYDWPNTRAFSLPTDQYGWIRINLIGRESDAVVQPEEYDDLCAEPKHMLLSLESEDGELLVHEVNRTAPDAEAARLNPLPDLVVLWRDAAFSSSLRLKGSEVPAQMVSKKSTGQHTTTGFCIYRGDSASDGVVEAKDLSRLIAASL